MIFHLAAVVSVPQTIENPIESAAINEIGSLSVFETAREKKMQRVVFSSSCAVYGDDPRLPKLENMAPNPLSPYAVQKLAAEYYAQMFYDLHGVETTVLRYFNVYGPRQDPSSPYSGVISVFMTKALLDEPAVIYGDGNQSRDFIYVQDVVRANLLAATTGGVGGRVINIGSGQSVRNIDLWMWGGQNNFWILSVRLLLKQDSKRLLNGTGVRGQRSADRRQRTEVGRASVPAADGRHRGRSYIWHKRYAKLV